MDAVKVTEMLQAMLLDVHVLLVLVLVGGVTEAVKRVCEKILGWEQKRVYIALLPLVPETLGMIVSVIPGTLPPMLAGVSWIVKLGFGVLAGMVSSKMWKIVSTLGEKPEVVPAPAPVEPPQGP